MTLALIFISALFLGLVFVFYFRKRKTKDLNTDPEGMSFKYKRFINLVLEHDKTARVEELKSHSFVIRTSGPKNTASFSLTEVMGKISVVWTWSDPSFGRRGKEWAFPDTCNQESMFNEITEDIINYQIAIYQKHNQRMSLRH
jgi:hypothetical protein